MRQEPRPRPLPSLRGGGAAGAVRAMRKCSVGGVCASLSTSASRGARLCSPRRHPPAFPQSPSALSSPKSENTAGVVSRHLSRVWKQAPHTGDSRVHRQLPRTRVRGLTLTTQLPERAMISFTSATCADRAKRESPNFPAFIKKRKKLVKTGVAWQSVSTSVWGKRN